MEQIQASATFPDISADNAAEFKQVALAALDSARGEAGTLQYDWFFSDDGRQCVVRETYSSSDAVLAHLGNIAPLLGRLVDLGGGIRLEVFGDPSATLREAIAAFQPPVFSFAQGK